MSVQQRKFDLLLSSALVFSHSQSVSFIPRSRLERLDSTFTVNTVHVSAQKSNSVTIDIERFSHTGTT